MGSTLNYMKSQADFYGPEEGITPQQYLENQFLYYINSYLDKSFEKQGVFSVASKWNCPLMWSHYADHHRGICIEYNSINHKCPIIEAVNYNKSRHVLTSDIEKWIKGSDIVEKEIFNTFFFSKAPSWEYEKEWRIINPKQGEEDAPLKISGIYFGLRCDRSVLATLVNILKGSEVQFYSIRTKDKGFTLKKEGVDEEDCFILKSRAWLFDEFTEIPE